MQIRKFTFFGVFSFFDILSCANSYYISPDRSKALAFLRKNVENDKKIKKGLVFLKKMLYNIWQGTTGLVLSSPKIELLHFTVLKPLMKGNTYGTV